ncbi:serine protein kinase [Paenibacillus naphthalenovorans]|uniref:Protein prkA n=1 Tax=Paenibacillus naphthalenovorans TaxID=162209 RepID=A0A0U2VRJ8_9BACL|nr:protein prkA [Paenibacillus naphthalenovorans]
METYKWILKRESELVDAMNQIAQELDTLKVVREYLYKTFVTKAAQELFEKYIKHIEGYCNWQKVYIDGVGYEPDEKLMRSIEEKIGISENDKKSFREEILIRLSAYNRKGKIFDYTSHEGLKEAIEKSL